MAESEVLIGFGSNLGDRLQLINQALTALSNLPRVHMAKLSSLYETAPVGYLEQGAFLNGVVQIRTSLSASELLPALLAIETSLGRKRTERWGPRTVDLDILFYAGQIITGAELSIPHPELVRRLFVLEPLCEIVPGWIHPEYCETVTVLLHKYQMSCPLEEPCRLVGIPVDAARIREKEKDGIFYRYCES
jgi:2-amino-4-hydroxy-6-hydroxymethyldihydropteridine diphosphokinase